MQRLLFCFLLLTASCNYSIYKDQAGAGGSNQGQGTGTGTCTPADAAAGPVDTGISFAQVQAEVFQPRCFNCHGNGASAGGVNLSSYTSAKGWAALIKSDVVNNVMPKAPNPPLSQAEKDLVVAWVDAGAPDAAGSANPVACADQPPAVDDTPTTPPPADDFLTEVPADGDINYKLVREKIFKFRCLSCHSTAGGNSGGLNLETYFNTVDEADDIYEEVAELNMPPPPRPALNMIERRTLLRWIELGAPQ